MVERKGKLNAKVVKDTTCETLTRETVRYVKDALVCTDEWWGYNSIKKLFKHSIVNHKCKEYVRGDIHQHY